MRSPHHRCLYWLCFCCYSETAEGGEPYKVKRLFVLTGLAQGQKPTYGGGPLGAAQGSCGDTAHAHLCARVNGSSTVLFPRSHKDLTLVPP